MAIIDTFMHWWNLLAQRNGKLKFRTREEAAEFVRKVHQQNGGPNEKIRAMRERYEEVNRTRANNTTTQFNTGGNSPVYE